MGYNVTVNGTPTYITKRELLIAANLFLPYLVGPRLAKNITVKIQLKRNLIRREGNVGDCDYTDSNSRPRKFKIRLDSSLRRKEMIETLGHEMIHVKQYARGEMKDLLVRGVTKWGGRYFSFDDDIYDDLPWEKEAFSREKEIADLFYNFANSTNLKKK